MITLSSKTPFPDVLVINEEKIAPGENKKIQLSAGKLPSGSLLSITTHIFRSHHPGPTVLLLGGIHGDEINGIEIITNLLASGFFSDIKAGCIIAIPLLNVFGFNNMSRDMPDGKDVNRSFPGHKSGSLASRVAKCLTQNILPHTDYAIDLHTGGSLRSNFPHTRYSPHDEHCKKLADVFNAPFAVKQALITNSFRKIAHEMNTHVLVYEAGESMRIDNLAVSTGVAGILHILTHLDMLPQMKGNIKNDQVIHINKTTWIRAAHPGIFTAAIAAGQNIQQGEMLGIIKDPYGLKSYPIVSRYKGHVLGINHAAVVNQGDALFHLGSYDEKHN